MTYIVIKLEDDKQKFSQLTFTIKDTREELSLSWRNWYFLKEGTKLKSCLLSNNTFTNCEKKRYVNTTAEKNIQN